MRPLVVLILCAALGCGQASTQRDNHAAWQQLTYNMPSMEVRQILGAPDDVIQVNNGIGVQWNYRLRDGTTKCVMFHQSKLLWVR